MTRVSDASGSFADTLRRAIECRGLGLERIRDHLELRGVSVSVATLSYWQSGRSAPGRRASLAAIPHLETVLGLARGDLSRTLPLTRDRPRRGVVQELGALWPEEARAAVLGRLDTRWDAELDRLSLHDVIRIGPDRRQVEVSVHQVMRARTDGPDRRVVLHCQDDTSVDLPRFEAVRGCSVGRVEHDRRHGVIAAELMFPEALRRGDTVIVAYHMVPSWLGPLEREWERRQRLPMRDYVLEVEFDRAALPASILAVTNGQESPLTLDRDHRVHQVHTDVTPGTTGIRWTWPED